MAASTGDDGAAQARKLGLKAGLRLSLDQAPAHWQLMLTPECEMVADGESADVVLAFFTDAAQLAERLPALGERVYPAGAVWAAWPRRAGGHRSDITDNVIREHALPLGLVDTLVAAIDTDWSGLRLVWRLERRGSARA